MEMTSLRVGLKLPIRRSEETREPARIQNIAFDTIPGLASNSVQ
jgi:hypothetical protein